VGGLPLRHIRHHGRSSTFTDGSRTAVLSAFSLAPQGDIVIWSGEDSVTDTLKPRLIAMGAEPDGEVEVGAQIIDWGRLEDRCHPPSVIPTSVAIV
jgi:hypothetical protein